MSSKSDSCPTALAYYDPMDWIPGSKRMKGRMTDWENDEKTEKKKKFESELFVLCEKFGEEVRQLYLKHYSVKGTNYQGFDMSRWSDMDKVNHVLHCLSDSSGAILKEKRKLSGTDPIIIMSPLGAHNIPWSAMELIAAQNTKSISLQEK